MSPAIVAIPGMPGESVDSRILPDVLAIMKKYKVKVTDGYATSGHEAGGEHPLGLAVDLVPDTARGGTWDDVDRLANWAEPKQNAPSSPFRWVGYNGDPNHGKGNHLHLSWLHPGATVTTAHGAIPDNSDGGRSIVATVLDPTGLLAGATGVAGKAAGAATDAAGTAAKALLNVLWDAFGDDGAKIVLYIALVLGGATLTVVGLTRALGVGSSPLQLAALATPVGRGAKIAAGGGATKAAAGGGGAAKAIV